TGLRRMYTRSHLRMYDPATAGARWLMTKSWNSAVALGGIVTAGSGMRCGSSGGASVIPSAADQRYYRRSWAKDPPTARSQVYVPTFFTRRWTCRDRSALGTTERGAGLTSVNCWRSVASESLVAKREEASPKRTHESAADLGFMSPPRSPEDRVNEIAARP